MTAQGTLYVVATPIGNLGDITIRALEILRSVHVIAAEDTRITARLLGRYEISTPTISFREQNAFRATPQIIERLNGGQDVALVSDAGTPSISDPGQQLVAAAVKEGIRVSPIPGPSALAAAISVAALEGEGVRFAGFIPRAGKARRERIAAIAADPASTVIYESPSRLSATLQDLKDQCGDRPAMVTREMTKIHEEIARGTLAELIARFAGPTRGEITIVLGGNRIGDTGTVDDAGLEELVRNRISAGESAKDCANALARALGVPKKKIYQLAVTMLNE